MTILLLFVTTIISGYADSRGFVYSSQIWQINKEMNYLALFKSGLSFAIGIIAYWAALKFLKDLGVATSPEVQTLGWFIVTIIGVALSSGEFLKWNILDKTISSIIIISFICLLLRGH